VAINYLTAPEKLSTVLKYDSVHGTYPGESSIKERNLSIIFDAELTRAMDSNFIEISAWYDYETGYAYRVVDLILKVNELSRAAS